MAQRVLIVGGTGFLGRQAASTLKSRYPVVLSGRIEAKNLSAQERTGCEVVTLDVTNADGVRRAFDKVRPTIVIHAAANKFVDLVEAAPMESIDVNLLGAENVARAAMDHDVAAVVGISSTAATPPQTNVYGLAKAIVERLFCSLNGKTKTRFTSVRLANIAWSTGSVLPAWRKMLAEGGEIRTTGPEQRRFFCSLDGAVKAVITALDRLDDLGGRVLVPKLKQAPIKEVLARFVEHHGGTWKAVEERSGERGEDALVGELEVPYTSEVMFDGAPHYVIAFNEKARQPIAHGIRSSNAEALSRDEIVTLVTNAPSATH